MTAFNAFIKFAADASAYSTPVRPKKPYKASELATYFLGKREYPLDYLSGEYDEYRKELEDSNKEGIEEELQDVMFAAQMLAYHRTGQDRRVVGADGKIKVFIDRVDNFKRMFDERGVPFSVDYLAGGSNYKKPEKIVRAFEKAGSPITMQEAADLSARYTGMQKTASDAPPRKGAKINPDSAPLLGASQQRKWPFGTPEHSKPTHRYPERPYPEESESMMMQRQQERQEKWERRAMEARDAIRRTGIPRNTAAYVAGDAQGLRTPEQLRYMILAPTLRRTVSPEDMRKLPKLLEEQNNKLPLRPTDTGPTPWSVKELPVEDRLESGVTHWPWATMCVAPVAPVVHHEAGHVFERPVLGDSAPVEDGKSPSYRDPRSPDFELLPMAAESAYRGRFEAPAPNTVQRSATQYFPFTGNLSKDLEIQRKVQAALQGYYLSSLKMPDFTPVTPGTMPERVQVPRAMGYGTDSQRVPTSAENMNKAYVNWLRYQDRVRS